MKQFTKIVVAIALLVGITGTIKAQSKIAHINSQALVEAMPSYKTAMSDLEKLQASYQTEIQELAGELQKTRERYSREAETQTPDENQRRVNEVQETQVNIQKYQQTAYTKLQEREGELLKPVYESARVSIQKVARAKGYDFVLDSTPGAAGVIMADGYDLMPDVKQELNL